MHQQTNMAATGCATRQQAVSSLPVHCVGCGLEHPRLACYSILLDLLYSCTAVLYSAPPVVMIELVIE